MTRTTPSEVQSFDVTLSPLGSIRRIAVSDNEKPQSGTTISVPPESAAALFATFSAMSGDKRPEKNRIIQDEPNIPEGRRIGLRLGDTPFSPGVDAVMRYLCDLSNEPSWHVVAAQTPQHVVNQELLSDLLRDALGEQDYWYFDAPSRDAGLQDWMPYIQLLDDYMDLPARKMDIVMRNGDSLFDKTVEISQQPLQAYLCRAMTASRQLALGEQDGPNDVPLRRSTDALVSAMEERGIEDGWFMTAG